MEAPLLRSLLRALIFAACIETIFYRLLTIPSGAPAAPWVEALHASTGRAGALMFFIAFVLALPTLMAIAYAALRAPAWPGALNFFVVMGLLTLLALGVSSAVSPRGPAFALVFTFLSLLVGLAMLAGMFESRQDVSGKAFAVCLAAALVCMAAWTGSELSARLAGWSLPEMQRSAAAASGRWLLFASGVTAYFAFSPPGRSAGGVTTAAASYGVSVATAFTLIFGVVAHPPLLSRVAPALQPDPAGSLSRVITTSAAAAAIFLVTLTIVRGMKDPAARTRACGLLFLLLAGYPYRVAYQHLLALLGLALLTAAGGARRFGPAADGMSTAAGLVGDPPAQDA